MSRPAPSIPRSPIHPAVERWLREPLLHFAVVGGLLFAVDAWIVGSRPDSRTIVLTADVDREAREVFRASRGREPDATELEALRRVWLDNEVLYREGLALQVDKGDRAIRERVIFKALSVVDANVRLPPYDEQRLRAWFEARRQKYDEPARYDFEEAALAEDRSEEAVRAFVDALNDGLPGDAKAGLRVFRNRPQANVAQNYGEAFATALAGLPHGRWTALQTADGWRAIRVNAATTARPASFEALKGVVLQDWTDATLAEQRSAEVRKLAKKYSIRIEEAAKS